MQDRQIELLTAFIDGEVTRRERIAVLRLLNQSSEARRTLWQLQQNSLALKQLPAKTLPANFSSTIVGIIAKTAAVPVPARPVVPSRLSRKVFVRLAWAAGLLLAVTGGLYYFLHDPQATQIAKSEGEKPVIELPSLSKEDPPRIVPNKDDPKPFDGRFVFADLKQRPQQELLEKELARTKVVRVDLYVKNPSQALDRLGRKMQFQADLKKNQEKVPQLFVENLAPADVAGFLAELAREDKGTFKNMQVQPMSGEDQKLLCGMLHIDSKEFSNPVERTKLPDLIQSKDKKDLPPPSVKQPQAPERRAVLLTREDARTIQNFVDQRRLLKPGTVQILFVIHPSA